ncbi:hypothetical protein DJ39_2465 [Yersinia ruckeri ATCC 29473]|uniref:Uncharacterized protein n=1 Tax=Yersinia ruckeri TaxID=29486 RepID=A0A380QPJ1_YERRU|nr:hypothetical protein QMA0440_00152 [Yersinia ruckeri]KGA43995.1 hypothetical protein DJ39_2465 [Yersinia ruckeri ATCC 29473]KFE38964.1 MobA [Yersinia ruckeri]CNB48283.1 Uncharacterised protein [Yersinia ruckeri]CNI28508.1 Uncharacterised protein [Yersinia ruckeri]
MVVVVKMADRRIAVYPPSETRDAIHVPGFAGNGRANGALIYALWMSNETNSFIYFC